VFQKYILVLERNDIDISELHDILSEAFNQISQRQQVSFYGMNVNLGLLKYDQSQKTKFMKEAEAV
jgi:ATP-dependent Zn protease